MKFKFNATIILQAQGECEVGADHVHVYTTDKLVLIPTFMLDNAVELNQLPEEEQKAICQIITNNLLKRGSQQTHIPDVTLGMPVPLTPPEGGKVN